MYSPMIQDDIKGKKKEHCSEPSVASRRAIAAGDLQLATLGLTLAWGNNAAGDFRARSLARLLFVSLDYPWAERKTATKMLN